MADVGVILGSESDQMPAGIPVVTVATGSAGARKATWPATHSEQRRALASR